MATRYIVRGVHTTRATFKATPQSLGFGNSTQGRERVLPTLNVSASARQNVGAAGGDGAPKTKQGAGGQGQGQSGRAIDRRPRTPKGERGERRGPSQGASGTGNAGSAPRTPRSPPPRRAPTAELPAEFFEGSELAAHEPSRARPRSASGGPKGSRGKNSSSGNASGRPKKQKESKGRGLGRNDGAEASPRSPRPQRSYAPTRLAVEVKRDTSPRSLFGPASLIAPSLRSARDAPASFWAKGMEPAQSRKADILRTAGDYSVFTPARPQGKGEKLAQSTGIWAIGMNPSIPMRRAVAGTDVFKTYLK